jgi:hypothetical protein
VVVASYHPDVCPDGLRKYTKALGIPRLRWEDNIKMDLREIEWGAVDWIYLVHDRVQWRALLNTVMKPSSSIKCWEILE